MYKNRGGRIPGFKTAPPGALSELQSLHPLSFNQEQYTILDKYGDVIYPGHKDKPIFQLDESLDLSEVPTRDVEQQKPNIKLLVNESVSVPLYPSLKQGEENTPLTANSYFINGKILFALGFVDSYYNTVSGIYNLLCIPEKTYFGTQTTFYKDRSVQQQYNEDNLFFEGNYSPMKSFLDTLFVFDTHSKTILNVTIRNNFIDKYLFIDKFSDLLEMLYFRELSSVDVEYCKFLKKQKSYISKIETAKFDLGLARIELRKHDVGSPEHTKIEAKIGKLQQFIEKNSKTFMSMITPLEKFMYSDICFVLDKLNNIFSLEENATDERINLVNLADLYNSLNSINTLPNYFSDGAEEKYKDYIKGKSSFTRRNFLSNKIDYILNELVGVFEVRKVLSYFRYCYREKFEPFKLDHHILMTYFMRRLSKPVIDLNGFTAFPVNSYNLVNNQWYEYIGDSTTVPAPRDSDFAKLARAISENPLPLFYSYSQACVAVGEVERCYANCVESESLQFCKLFFWNLENKTYQLDIVSFEECPIIDFMKRFFFKFGENTRESTNAWAQMLSGKTEYFTYERPDNYELSSSVSNILNMIIFMFGLTGPSEKEDDKIAEINAFIQRVRHPYINNIEVQEDYVHLRFLGGETFSLNVGPYHTSHVVVMNTSIDELNTETRLFIYLFALTQEKYESSDAPYQLALFFNQHIIQRKLDVSLLMPFILNCNIGDIPLVLSTDSLNKFSFNADLVSDYVILEGLASAGKELFLASSNMTEESVHRRLTEIIPTIDHTKLSVLSSNIVHVLALCNEIQLIDSLKSRLGTTEFSKMLSMPDLYQEIPLTCFIRNNSKNITRENIYTLGYIDGQRIQGISWSKILHIYLRYANQIDYQVLSILCSDREVLKQKLSEFLPIEYFFLSKGSRGLKNGNLGDVIEVLKPPELNNLKLYRMYLEVVKNPTLEFIRYFVPNDETKQLIIDIIEGMELTYAGLYFMENTKERDIAEYLATDNQHHPFSNDRFYAYIVTRYFIFRKETQQVLEHDILRLLTPRPRVLHTKVTDKFTPFTVFNRLYNSELHNVEVQVLDMMYANINENTKGIVAFRYVMTSDYVATFVLSLLVADSAKSTLYKGFTLARAYLNSFSRDGAQVEALQMKRRGIPDLEILTFLTTDSAKNKLKIPLEGILCDYFQINRAPDLKTVKILCLDDSEKAKNCFQDFTPLHMYLYTSVDPQLDIVRYLCTDTTGQEVSEAKDNALGIYILSEKRQYNVDIVKFLQYCGGIKQVPEASLILSYLKSQRMIIMDIFEILLRDKENKKLISIFDLLRVRQEAIPLVISYFSEELTKEENGLTPIEYYVSTNESIESKIIKSITQGNSDLLKKGLITYLKKPEIESAFVALFLEESVQLQGALEVYLENHQVPNAQIVSQLTPRLRGGKLRVVYLFK